MLLMGIDLEELVQYPARLVDEPDNITPGFYFGDIPQNYLVPYKTHIWMSTRFATMASGGELVLNHPHCYRSLEEVASI